MANGDDQEQVGGNQNDPFADLESSITDSFSRLQESMDRYADQLEEMQDSAQDTLYSSSFMESLNEQLTRIGDQNEELIQQQNDLQSEFESLNTNISELNSNISELRDSLSTFNFQPNITAEVDVSELEVLTEAYLTAAENTRSVISSEINSLSSDLTRAYSNIVNEYSLDSETLLEVAVLITEGFETNIDRLTEEISGEFSNLRSKIDNILGRVETVFATQVESLSENLRTAVSSIEVESSFDRSELFVEVITSIREVVDAGFDTLSGDIAQYIEVLESSVVSKIDQLSSNLNVETLGESILNLTDQISEEYQNRPSYNFDEIFSRLKETYTSSFEVVEERLLAIQNASGFENIEDRLFEMQNILEGKIFDISISTEEILNPLNTFREDINANFDQLFFEIENFSEAVEELGVRLQSEEEEGPEISPSNLNVETLGERILNLTDQIREEYTRFEAVEERLLAIQNAVQRDYNLNEIFTRLENVFTSGFENIEDRLFEMQSILEGKIFDISISTEELINPFEVFREDVNANFDQLFFEFESLTEAVRNLRLYFESEEQENVDVSPSSLSVDPEIISQAVQEGVISAMTEMQMRQVAQQRRGGRLRNRPNQNESQVQQQTPNVPQSSFSFSGINTPNFGAMQGVPRISNLLTGNVSLNEEFPEFLAELEARNESLSNTVKLTNGELEDLDGNIADLIEKGGKIEELTLGDALSGNLNEAASNYNQAINQLFSKFEDIIGEQGEKLVSTTRNIVTETRERLRYEDIVPDNFAGMVSKELGYEEVYEELNTFAQKLEDQFINASANINDLALPQSFIERLDQTTEEVQNLEGFIEDLQAKEEDMGMEEIKARVAPMIRRQFDQFRGSFEEFQVAQDELINKAIENMVESGGSNLDAIEDEVTGVLDEQIGQRFNKQLAGSINQVIEVYQQLEQQGMEATEIQSALATLTQQIREESEEIRQQSDEFADLQDEILDKTVENLSAVERIKNAREAQNEIYQRYFGMLQTVQNRYEDMQTLISGIGEALSSPKMWGFAALNGVLALAYQVYDQIMEIDSVLRQLADSTGLTADRLNDARNIVMDLAGPLMARGATLQEVAGTVGTIVSSMEGLAVATERLGMTQTGLAESIGTVATGFNISNEAAGELLSSMQAITGLTGESLTNAIGITQSLAEARGVAPKGVINDIRDATEEIAKFGDLSAENIAEAAVSARELGSNLNEVLGIAEGFRNNIVGSIQSLQQAELMLGQQIPVENLVATSFEDPEAFTSQLRSTLADLDLDLEGPLATYRLQSLSEAFGVSTMRLRQMAESAELAEQNLRDLEGMERVQSLTHEIKASQTSFEQVTNSITGFGQTILNALAQPIMNTVEPVLGELTLLLEDIYNSFEKGTKMAEAFDIISAKVTQFGEGADESKAKAAGIASTILSFAEGAYELGKALIPVTKGLADIVTGIAPLVEFLADTIGLFHDMGAALDQYQSYFEDLGSTLGTIAGLVVVGGGLYKGISALTGLFTSTSDAADVAQKGVGGLGSAFKSFGAQALMVAGAALTVSKAMQNLAELSWGGIAKGIVGLAGSLTIMTVAIRTMSGALSSVNWATMAAAGGTMIAFAGAAWILADAMEGFAEAGAAGLGVMAGSLGILTAFGGTLAALIGGTGGLGAGAALAAAGVLGAFGLALQAVAHSINMFAESAMKIGEAAEQIGELENVDNIADNIRELSGALSNLPEVSWSNFFSGLIGEGVADQIQMLVRLARQADPLDSVASSINKIGDSLQRLSQIDASATLSQLEDITSMSIGEGIGNLFSSVGRGFENMLTVDQTPQAATGAQNIEGQEATQGVAVDPFANYDPEVVSGEEEASTYSQEVVQNSEEMINLLQEIAENENELLGALRNGEVAVYMDGDEVTDKVYKNANVRNSRS